MAEKYTICRKTGGKLLYLKSRDRLALSPAEADAVTFDTEGEAAAHIDAEAIKANAGESMSKFFSIVKVSVDG